MKQATLSHPIVQYLIDRATATSPDQRREQQRYPISVAVMVQPLDGDLNPVGQEFRAITKDVSESGLGFVYSEPVAHRLLRLRLADHATPLIVEVRHCSRLGDMGLLYVIGSQFTSLREKTS